MRLLTKLTLATLIPSAFFLLLLAWTGQKDLVRYLRDNTVAKELETLHRIKEHMFTDIRRAQEVLRLISVMAPPTGSDHALTRSRFNNFLGEIPELIQLSSISLQGAEVLRVEEFRLFQQSREAKERYLFNSPIYRIPLLEKRVYTGNIRLSPDIDKPIIDVSISVKDLDTGRINGVLWGVAALRDLPEAMHQTVSKNGSIGLVNRQTGKIICKAGEGMPPAIERLLKGKENVQEFEEEGILYTLSKLPVTFRDLDLIVYSQVPNKTIYSLSDFLEKRNRWIITLGILATMATVLLLVRRLTKKLAKTTGRIVTLSQAYRSKKAEAPATPASDEVEQLSEAFALFEKAILSRQHKIEMLNKNLEEKVRQRTEELETLNRELEQRVTAEVTKRRKREELMIQQSKLAQMGEMVTMIAHNWRQPLTVIGLTIQNLADAYRFGELDEALLEEAKHEIMDYLNQLSETLNTLSTYMVRQQETRDFDGCTAARELYELIQPELKASFIQPDFECAPTPIMLHGAPPLFGQILHHLVKNAQEAVLDNPKNNRKIVVTLIQTDTQTALLTVWDNGKEIDAAVLPRLFEPFFTTKSAATKTGLGLYTVKMLTEQQFGGSVEVESRPDNTEFRITLPLATHTPKDTST